MGVIDNAKKHFVKQEQLEIEVPEWGTDDSPLIIYADPMTIKDRNWTLTRAKNDPVAALVYTIIRMAKYKDGTNIFTIEHKRDLMTKVDSKVVIRIANEIMRVDTVDDLKKN